MSYVHSNLPPDARGYRSFNIIHGFDQMFRDDQTFGCLDTDFTTLKVGEPLRNEPSEDAKVFKVIDSTGDVGIVIGVNADASDDEDECVYGLSFSKYSHDGTTGFSGAEGAGKVTVLRGEFIARVKESSWFVSDDDEVLNVAVLPTGMNSITSDNNLAIGRDVVAIQRNSGTNEGYPQFICLPNAYDTRYGAALSAEERAVDHAVIGKVIRYQTVNGENFVDIRFKL